MKGTQRTATARLRPINDTAMELDVSTPSLPTISRGCNQTLPKQVDLLSNNLGGNHFCGAKAGKSPICMNRLTRATPQRTGTNSQGSTEDGSRLTGPAMPSKSTVIPPEKQLDQAQTP